MPADAPAWGKRPFGVIQPTLWEDEQGVHALMPGHYIKAQLLGEKVEVSDTCYWDVSCASEDMIQDYDKCKELLREVLISSAEYCCIGERNGVHLSGGIDSTIVTGIMSTLLGHRTDSFTMTSQVVVAETVIVGDVPQTFLQTGG